MPSDTAGGVESDVSDLLEYSDDDASNFTDGADMSLDADDEFASDNGFYDDDDGFGDDQGFLAGIHTKDDSDDNHNLFKVEYQVHAAQALQELQRTEASEVCAIFGISLSHATMMLRAMRWNKETFMERFTEDPERVQREAGIPVGDTDAVLARPLDPSIDAYFAARTEPAQAPAEAQFVATDRLSPEAHVMRGHLQIFVNHLCEICFTESADIPTYALHCGHRFCVECYHEYLCHKITGEGLSARIQCPAPKCSTLVDEPSVAMLVSPGVYRRYEGLLLRSFVDENDAMRWCPAPGCEYVVECHTPHSALTSIVPTVRCQCGHLFCFGCGLSDHQPCICVLAKRWLRKCIDDSETATWISAHTKECTRCKTMIEKNGGCNHMTCRKCGYEFCWVCLGPWSEHGQTWYNCNRFNERSSQQARSAQEKSRAALQRYLHYYGRYANHEHSAQLDHQLYLKTEKKMEKMQRTSDLSWIEVQFLKEAVDTVFQSRMTLKWTYAFAFYLAHNNMTHLFEDNQRDLEMATELLSELLEKPLDPKTIPALRQQVLDKTSYVAARRQVVLNDTAKGLMEDRWQFTASLSD
ncbi:hypothetical protein H4R34_001495 [Dimargaris verticillata]|uniref:RBR-type E3 ubiquitin transferase n=1 Tax=Dimargaris verticillata TaxID=2761393 RepID=A0A9W8EEG0_9FUNG|nr:hypothetical protein H4R34_001495 [Dimargaris verticillata]